MKGTPNLLAYAEEADRPDVPGFVLRPDLPTTTAACSRCGTQKRTAALRSTRVPGVGTVYACRTCPPAEGQR